MTVSVSDSKIPQAPAFADPVARDWRVFSPEFDDGGVSLKQLLDHLNSPSPVNAMDKLAGSICESLSKIKTLSRRRLRLLSSALILRDLLRQGWSVNTAGNIIRVSPPLAGTGITQEAAKNIARQSGLFAREEQLKETSVRSFIHAMENPGKGSKCLPITHLIADGRILAQLLEPIAQLPLEQRGKALKSVIRPYLQIAEPDQRCTLTGIKLTDIWRYFRLKWSIPFNSTPGRNVFFLIRDAGQKYHPVIAIAALGNSVMQLTCRDDFLGWTPRGFLSLIDRREITEDEAYKGLLKSIDKAINEIYVDDLKVGKAELRRPSEAVIAQLLNTRERAAKARDKELEKGFANKKVEFDASTELRDIIKLARSPLFKLKRAKALAELLRAKMTLQRASRAENPVRSLYESEAGRMSVGVALRQIRNRKSGSAMMEIVVCGGIPPYSNILAGKLACLMMLSPEVRSVYRQKYSKQPSVIATQMAGRPIYRTAELSYLGTTSLYSVGSSQYNRVSLPAEIVQGQSERIDFNRIGITEGYGSAHLSGEAREVLGALAITRQKARRVNNVFGEGANPKMRQLSAGLDALGIGDADLLRHSSSRIVYSVPLVSNVARFLLEIDAEPNYLIGDNNVRESTNQIAGYWLDRWVSSRLDFQPVIARLRESTPLRLRLSKDLPVVESGIKQLRLPFADSDEDQDAAYMTVTDERLEFLRRLYKEESAFSDNVDIGRLRELHIKTSLESVIEDLIEQGKSIVLTGNAGDGKTHLIRVLERKLNNKKAWVISDASGVDLQEMLSDWQAKLSAGTPCFVAINEGPLLDLIKSNRQQFEFLTAIDEQLRSSIEYVSVNDEAKKPKTRKKLNALKDQIVVIDLSLRQHLSTNVVAPVLSKLTEDKWYEGCAQCPNFARCGVTYNRNALKDPAIQTRVGRLLENVATRGEQATFREVLGFASFLIFGARSCAELIELGESERARYYSNAFEFGDGHIFNELRKGLDPINRTSPVSDAELWNGQFDATTFKLAPAPVAVPLDPLKSESLVQYKALKRRWYFEHPDGDKLSPRSPAEDSFFKLADNSKTIQARVSELLRLINRYNLPADRDFPDKLRLWTKLAYSPRSQSKAMVSGRAVSSQALSIFKPVLNDVMTAAFGEQPLDHLILALDDPSTARLANLRVDVRLLHFLLTRSIASLEDNESVRRLTRFNEALAIADKGDGGDFRTIVMVEGKTGREVRLRIDLRKRRYDGVTSSRD